MASWLWIFVGLAPLVALSACGDEDKRETGVVCASSEQCVSGLCHNAVCLDPDADDDGDGLLNAQEALLNTHPFNPDTDGDGPNDLEEVGADLSQPLDADGDNDPAKNERHDALESMSLDADKDCIEDQFDPADDVVETQPTLIARYACPDEGVCGAEGAEVRASCDTSVDPPERTCTFEDVPDYESGVAGETSCDARDNDCDGFIDEGISYEDGDGGSSKLGEECQGHGSCAPLTGVVECEPNTRTAICSVNLDGTDSDPAREEASCNNKDDDCDGQTDEGVELSTPDGALAVGEHCVALGVCSFSGGQGESASVECVIEDGVERAVCSTGPGGSVDASEPELCDTLDNDCDGEVDEGISWPARDGSPVGLGEGCGVGACEGGTVVCIAGAATCSTFALATDGFETCNQIDDDCDGLTDEADGLELNCPKLGVCAELEPLKVGCDGDGVYCSYLGVDGYEAGDETSCNGLDDDCDGVVDEGLSGPDGAELDAPCQGQGACAGYTGSVVCGADADGESMALCSADQDNGSVEMCDGVDDDCDGLTDEDAEGAPEDMDCLTGGVCQGQQDTGAMCSDGVWVCAYSVVSEYEELESTCDGLDNDCDDLIDEGVAKVFEPGAVTVVETQPAHRGRWPMASAGAGVWLYGGLHRGQGIEGSYSVALDDLWTFDLESGQWFMPNILSEEGPGPRWGHAVAWIAELDVLLVSGGYQGLDDGAAPEADLWAYFAQTQSWELVAQESDSELPKAVAWHSLTPVGAATVLLAGGVAANQTWLGTLALSPDEPNSLTCSWQSVEAGPVARSRHAAVYRQSANEVWLLGGALEGVAPVSVLSLDDLSTWSTPVAYGELPGVVQDTCAVVSDEDVVLFGGRKNIPEEPASDAASLPTVWRITDSDTGWKVNEVSVEEPIGLAGCLAIAAGEGDALIVLPGAANGFASWSKSFTFELESGVWGEAQAWSGIPPRLGASIAVRPTDGAVWAFGGVRSPQGAPLQDVWRLESDGSWTSVVPALSLSALGPDKTIPALSGASTLWDPVSQRVLLYGGDEHGVFGVKPSTTIWSFTPETGEFAKEDGQGDSPTAMDRGAIFGNALEPGVAWFAGVSSNKESEGELGNGSLQLYGLDLAVLNWTYQASATLEVGASKQWVSLVGGTSAQGLDLVYLTPDGALAAGTFDGESWVAGGLIAPGAYVGFVTGAYDPIARASLVMARSAQGTVSVMLVNHVTFAAEPFELDAAGGEASLTDAALVVHPVMGALGVGGRDVSAVTRSAETLFGQTCP